MSTGGLAPHTPRLQTLVVRAVIRACTMGLLPERADYAISGREVAVEALTNILDAARSAGIARGITVPVDTNDAARWEELAAKLLAALEESPLLELEWPALERVLGAKLLAALVDVSPNWFRHHAPGTSYTQNDVAERLHFLALVVGDISGSYNDLGVRRWFGRPRTQLGDRSPAQLLEGAWRPLDEGPQQVRRLAVSLLGASA